MEGDSLPVAMSARAAASFEDERKRVELDFRIRDFLTVRSQHQEGEDDLFSPRDGALRSDWVTSR